MRRLRCAIVDDEILSVEQLTDIIKIYPDLSLVKTFIDPTIALIELLEEDKIDILFLDIAMPGLSGLELGAKLRDKVKYLIFVTACSQYALEAFGVGANNYLLKPIEKICFIGAIQAIMKLEKNQNKTFTSDLLFIKCNIKGRFISVNLADIILVYVEGHKLFIVTNNQRYETAESLKNIESKLSGDGRYLRIHNSNLINVKKIVRIEGNTIEMEGKYKVPISESYKKRFMDVVGI